MVLGVRRVSGGGSHSPLTAGALCRSHRARGGATYVGLMPHGELLPGRQNRDSARETVEECLTTGDEVTCDQALAACELIKYSSTQDAEKCKKVKDLVKRRLQERKKKRISCITRHVSGSASSCWSNNGPFANGAAKGG